MARHANKDAASDAAAERAFGRLWRVNKLTLSAALVGVVLTCCMTLWMHLS